MLATQLPLAIPLPLAKGEPADGYPWAWVVDRWLDGENPLPAGARRIFRAELVVDDAAWARGRGWALSVALIQLPYHSCCCKETNPALAANARHVIRGSRRPRGRPGSPTCSRE